MGDGSFGSRFRLALRAIGFSRAQAAMSLNVDKSLVGRWAAGTVRPTEHNLANITRLIGEHVAGFSMLDWERDFSDFAKRLGIDPAIHASMALPTAALNSLPLDFLETARAETQRRGATFEGFWRTTRPSVIMEGSIFHDHGIIRVAANGLLEVRMGGAGLSFNGWALPLQGNLFAILYDTVGMTPIFLVFRAGPLPKTVLMDGLVLLSALDAARTPAAIPILLERIGDLTGDREADDARYADLVSRPSMAEPGSVPQEIINHLIRDVGPAAAAAGGELFLTAAASTGLSRGSTQSGELQG